MKVLKNNSDFHALLWTGLGEMSDLLVASDLQVKDQKPGYILVSAI